MNGFLTNKLFSGVLGFVIVGVTVFSSVTGIVKVASSFEKPKQKVPEVRTVQSGPENKTEKVLSAETTAAPGNSGTRTPTMTRASVGLGNTGGSTLGVKPSVTMPTVSAQNAGGTNPNDCIITLFGKQYNVAPLRTTHSGGDVFKCGTDMTAAYQGQHGIDVTRMQPYLVTQSSTAGTTGGSTGGQNLGGSGQTANSSGTIGNSDDRQESEDHRESLEKDLHEVESGSSESSRD